MDLISIIVPVYEVEEYLSRCIESILAQTYQNIEVILVDDGSPDRCGKICDEYARKDSRIKIIHQQNGGAVKARLAGLEIASGKYIGFVDSDDYINPHMYELLYNHIQSDNGYDIVWCDVVIELQERQFVTKLDASENPSELLRQLLKGQYPGWMCNKLISSDFYKQCSIFQDPSCSMMEDVLIMTQLLYNNPKLKYVNEALYIYNRTNENAMTSGKVFNKALKNMEHIETFLKDKGCFHSYYNEFSTFAMKAKIELLNSFQYDLAKTIFPYSHKSLSSYPLKWPYRILYYLFFNTGNFGKLIHFLHLQLRIKNPISIK